MNAFWNTTLTVRGDPSVLTLRQLPLMTLVLSAGLRLCAAAVKFGTRAGRLEGNTGCI